MNKFQRKCYSLAKKYEAFDVVEALRGNRELKFERQKIYKTIKRYAHQWEDYIGTEVVDDAWHDEMFEQDATNEEVEEAMDLIKRYYNDNIYINGCLCGITKVEYNKPVDAAYYNQECEELL